MSADEIEACVRSEHARLVAVVAVVTGSRPLAEEAVQEAFARAWERARRGQSFDHLAGWVATVALNQARSGFRRRAAERRALDRLPVPRTDLDGPSETGIVLRAAIDGLAPRQRDAVVLYYLLDLDVRAVAALLGVSDGTVKTALSRARTTLARLLEDEEES